MSLNLAIKEIRNCCNGRVENVCFGIPRCTPRFLKRMEQGLATLHDKEELPQSSFLDSKILLN